MKRDRYMIILSSVFCEDDFFDLDIVWLTIGI